MLGRHTIAVLTHSALTPMKVSIALVIEGSWETGIDAVVSKPRNIVCRYCYDAVTRH